MSRLTGNVAAEVLAGRRDMNYGSPYENYVAQELVAHGTGCTTTRRRGEVDFVVEDKTSGAVSLVEVKSGKSYKRHVALSNLLSVGDYEFAHAYVLCNGNFFSCTTKALISIDFLLFLWQLSTTDGPVGLAEAQVGRKGKGKTPDLSRTAQGDRGFRRHHGTIGPCL